MTNRPTRMRDAGRSWTEIADALGLSVREAKVLVEVEKSRRRRDLATSHTNEEQRGLLEMCDCGHMRKYHELFEGECDACGPVRQAFTRVVWVGDERSDQVFDERPDDWNGQLPWRDTVEEVGCSEFYLAKKGQPRWMFGGGGGESRGPRSWKWARELAFSKPTDESGRIRAKYPRDQSTNWWWGRSGKAPAIPTPSARTRARRERRKRNAQ